MISTLSKMTAFEVEDRARPWGKIHDFLLEFPSGRTRYLSVDAHMGFGVKEVWAPMESVEAVDASRMAVKINAELDKGMLRNLSRLEAPRKDRDEIKLHRLYQSKPDWMEIVRKKGGRLRNACRLIRGSMVMGLEAVTTDGNWGRVLELFFDDNDLSLKMMRVRFEDGGRGAVVDFRPGTWGGLDLVEKDGRKPAAFVTKAPN